MIIDFLKLCKIGNYFFKKDGKGGLVLVVIYLDMY